MKKTKTHPIFNQKLRTLKIRKRSSSKMMRNSAMKGTHSAPAKQVRGLLTKIQFSRNDTLCLCLFKVNWKQKRVNWYGRIEQETFSANYRGNIFGSWWWWLRKMTSISGENTHILGGMFLAALWWSGSMPLRCGRELCWQYFMLVEGFQREGSQFLVGIV